MTTKTTEKLPAEATFVQKIRPYEVWATATHRYLVTPRRHTVIHASPREPLVPRKELYLAYRYPDHLNKRERGALRYCVMVELRARRPLPEAFFFADATSSVTGGRRLAQKRLRPDVPPEDWERAEYYDDPDPDVAQAVADAEATYTELTGISLEDRHDRQPV